MILNETRRTMTSLAIQVAQAFIGGDFLAVDSLVDTLQLNAKHRNLQVKVSENLDSENIEKSFLRIELKDELNNEFFNISVSSNAIIR